MASLTAPTAKLGSAEQAVVAQLIEAGQKFSQTPVRVTRCFSATVQSEDGSKVVRWILATPDHKLADLLDGFEIVGVEVKFDWGPRSKHARELQKLAFGGKGRGKSQPMFLGQKSDQ